MNVKKSKYNLFIPYGERTIIYNLMSGNIGTFDKDMLLRYETDTLSDEEVQKLLEKKILIDRNFNEIEKINQDRISSITNPNFKNFRIWPTSSCNARCYYCFEKGIPFITMSRDVVDATVQFIEENVNGGETFNVEWFGGEPLLMPSVINYIVEQVDEMCRRKNCKVRYTMISNGSLVDREMVISLKKWNVKSIQITLDGYKEDYNRVKNYINPQKYNFEKVIEGIQLLNDNDISVVIRMNYDGINYDSLKKLIFYLHENLGEREGIRYYVYPVWSSLIEGEGAFVSSTEADKRYVDLLKELVKYKMSDIRKIARLGYRRSQCHACHECGFTIFPDGQIGKCDEAFTQKVGDVWKGVTNKEIYSYWTSYELDEYCKECIYLPTCQGGCRASHHTKMPQCFAHKNVIAELLIWYINYMDAKREELKYNNTEKV